MILLFLQPRAPKFFEKSLQLPLSFVSMFSNKWLWNLNSFTWESPVLSNIYLTRNSSPNTAYNDFLEIRGSIWNMDFIMKMNDSWRSSKPRASAIISIILNSLITVWAIYGHNYKLVYLFMASNTIEDTNLSKLDLIPDVIKINPVHSCFCWMQGYMWNPCLTKTMILTELPI